MIIITWMIGGGKKNLYVNSCRASVTTADGCPPIRRAPGTTDWFIEARPPPASSAADRRFTIIIILTHRRTGELVVVEMYACVPADLTSFASCTINMSFSKENRLHRVSTVRPNYVLIRLINEKNLRAQVIFVIETFPVGPVNGESGRGIDIKIVLSIIYAVRVGSVRYFFFFYRGRGRG
jgi:hypothetical protein